MQRAVSGDLAELGLCERPEYIGLGVGSVRRVFELSEQGEVAEVFPGRRQLQIIFDLRRVVGYVLAIQCSEFVAKLEKPVRQRAVAVLGSVALIASPGRFVACELFSLWRERRPMLWLACFNEAPAASPGRSSA